MYESYYMNYGESLSDVANKFNTSVEELLKINGLSNSDMLRGDMDILVPKNKESYFTYYTVNTGDNLYAIARRYNINPMLLAALNGLTMDDYIYPNQKIIIPKAGYSFYITKDGDTFDMVANKFNKTKKEVLDLNETVYLLPGQLMINKNN